MKKVGDFLKNIDYKKHLWLIIVGGVFGLYLLLIATEVVFFSNRIGLFAKISNSNIQGKTEEEAIKILENDWKIYEASEVKVGQNTLIKPKDWTTNISAKKSVENLLEEQSKNFFRLSIFQKKNSNLQLNLREDIVGLAIEKENKDIFVEAKNANIEFAPEPKIIPEKFGRSINTKNATKTITENFGQRKNNITLDVEEIKPVIFSSDAQSLVEDAKLAIATNIVIKINEKDYTIDKLDLKNWLKLDKQNEEITFYDSKKVIDWVGNIASKVNSLPINAQLTITDGKASVFVASKNGFTLDQEKLILQIQTASTKEKNILATGEVKKPEITEDTLNNLGIKEQIAVGYSDFAGSTANRIHNIKTGASKFNGVLIKPDENFSFNKILGPVDASTGYLEELVILNDKTEKQFGGGLCQVSSTAFRAGLNAGLPILERTAHSYPVSYYKPYGVDASIYLPKPDLVFGNDTGKHILVQTRIVGTKIYFELYGTKVNRTIKFSGNPDAIGAVNIVENVNPYIYDQEARGRASFSAIFYRHIYDALGKLTDNDKFTSKYDSPDKYPR